MKRLISTILAAVLMFTSVPVQAFAVSAEQNLIELETTVPTFVSETADSTANLAEVTQTQLNAAKEASTVTEGTCGENLTWNLDNNGYLSIHGTGPMESYIYGSTPWFDLREEIYEVFISEGVTSVSKTAFSECSNLHTVSLPKTLTSLGSEAFEDCTSLNEIDIPKGIPKIGLQTFHGCTSLKKVAIPEGVTSIEQSAFEGCTALENIVLPSTVNSFGSSVFTNCPKLANINIPEGVTTIGTWMFSNCESLTSVTLPDSLTSIGLSAFSGCTSLASIVIPSGVSFIDESTFSDCSSLHTVSLSMGLEAIKKYAFSDCSSLKNIVLPESLTSLGDSVFQNCVSLTSIVIPDGVTSLSWTLFSGCTSLTDVTLSKNLKGTQGYAVFRDCTSLKSITIPEGVTGIYEYTFSGCTSLTDVKLPSTLESISKCAFKGCENLTSIIIPEGTELLGYSAFSSCTSLTEIVIPKSLTSIDSSAFSGCNVLKDVYYTGTETQWESIAIYDYGNDALEKATIHYNYEIPNENENESTDNYSQSVLYYLSWEKNTNTVYFGADGEISFLVTDETDVSTISDLFLGRYVVVQTKMEGEQEVLLSMAIPKTAVGTVTAINSTQITIDEETYAIIECPSNPEQYLNKKVVYHIYNEYLAGIEILQEKEGFLNHWHSDGRQLRIQTNATSNDPKFYHLGYQADVFSEDFLELSVNDSGQTDVMVDFLTDSNRVIYRITPCVEEREGGFSEIEHGWPIVNSRTCFGYPTGYAIDPALYYEHGFGAYSFLKEKYENCLDFPWSGNCFGLSLLAIAQYTGQVDLKPYFNTAGETLNEFGYTSIDRHEGGNRYVLYNYEDGRVVYSNDIIKKIEQAQVSLYSSEIAAIAEICNTWNFDNLIEYLSGDDPTPLLLGLWDFGHAVVTDTSKKPMYIGNNRYFIPLYDCNAPQLTNELEDAWIPYNYSQSMLYVDLESGMWGYMFNDKWKITDVTISNWDGLKIYDVSKLDKSFFNEHYSPYKHKTSIVFSADEVRIEYIDPGDGSQTTVFEYIDLQTWMKEETQFIPFIGDDDASEKIQGCVILPEGSYAITTKGKSYVLFINKDDMFVYGSDQNVVSAVNTQTDEITIQNAEKEANVQCIYANAQADFGTAIEAKLDAQKSASLRSDSEKKTSFISTNADTGAVIVTHVVDGEIDEDTSDMIHYHENLTFVEGSAATCTKPGQTNHYICGCGKIYSDENANNELSTLTIPALGHNWDDGIVTKEPTPEEPGIRTFHCENCEETRTEEIPYEGPESSSVQRIYGPNRIETALAVAKELKSVLKVDKFDSIILAAAGSGKDQTKFADALSGSYLANTRKAPILLYTKGDLAPNNLTFIRENLSENGIIYLLGSNVSVPDEVDDMLKAEGYTTKRLGGVDRYQTNLIILDEAGVETADEILIASGRAFADSLSASATGLPILLVSGNKTELTDAQVEFLQSVKGKKITILGGTAAVTAELEAAIERAVEGEVDRVFGSARENTSAMVAEKYFEDADMAFITYSKMYPDGLAGGVLANVLHAPLLLTKAGSESITSAYIKESGISSGYVLGGYTVLTDETARLVFGLNQSAVIQAK